MARKILIVDDNESNREELREILSENYEVLEAENGQEALTIIKHYFRVISVILLDIDMPVMDGYC
jgi:CheY-like chemotaxis protein